MDSQKKPIYPVEPWSVSETAFCPENNFRGETTFALSNGYIGTRGTLEEGCAFELSQGLEGNFINGFYESEPIRYGECCFGFPATSQTMLNVTNAKTVRIFLGGELLDLRVGTLESYRRTLHLDGGTVTRELVWRSPNGKRTRVFVQRLVSMSEKRLMALRFEVTPLDWSGELSFVSELDCDVLNHTRATNPLIDYGPYDRVLLPECVRAKDGVLYTRSRTKHTQLALACLCAHTAPENATQLCEAGEYLAKTTYTVGAKQNEPAVLEKYIAYTTSLDEDESTFEQTLTRVAVHAREQGFNQLSEQQRSAMSAFWEVADVRVRGNDALQQGLRFNLFHIMQAAGRDGRTGMAAKGLSGEGYEGHYFWDTELYVMPVFTHTFPALSRPLLEFRYSTLEQARDRAREMGHPKGALFPWRTINGTEASSYYPLGAAQYHINADVAFAFRQYAEVTGDEDFLAQMGAEVLCETSRVWADVGDFAESRDGKYCICCVTGPDEYNALVDNNFYTNLMARENLRDALDALALLCEKRPVDYARLVKRLELTPEETTLWRKIVDNMYLPQDERLGIYTQDDGFLQRKRWDDSRIPLEKRHLLFENYHPLFVFRHKMCKQADAILGMFLHDDLFTTEELKRNFDFYQTVTLHHSSLSTCIFGMLACRIGYHALAEEYFAQSARMDLDDYHENFFAGIHAANMAGTWLAMVNGFGGMRTNGGVLRFDPFLPAGWEGYAFRISFQGSVLEVDVGEGKVSYRLISGASVQFLHRGAETVLSEEGATQHETV